MGYPNDVFVQIPPNSVYSAIKYHCYQSSVYDSLPQLFCIFRWVIISPPLPPQKKNLKWNGLALLKRIGNEIEFQNCKTHLKKHSKWITTCEGIGARSYLWYFLRGKKNQKKERKGGDNRCF